MIKFLLRLPACILAFRIMEDLGYGDLAQIVAGVIGCILVDVLIYELLKAKS